MTQHLDTQTAQLFAHLRRGGNYSYSWAASHAKNADNEPIWKNSTLCNGAGPKEIPPEHHAIHSAAGTALGSYEAWSDVLGRILHGAGFSGFLGNLDALYDRTDAEGAAWRALIAAWWQTHEGTALPAGARDMVSVRVA